MPWGLWVGDVCVCVREKREHDFFMHQEFFFFFFSGQMTLRRRHGNIFLSRKK